jgi:hypothetical protein
MDNWRHEAINSPMAEAVRAQCHATIYEDPVTRTKVEGKAALLELITDYGDGYEMWIVRFENGEECYRTLGKQDIL